MKRLLFCSIITICVPSFAQLNITHNSQIIIGKQTINELNTPKQERDTISSIIVHGPIGDYGGGGRIAFGDSPKAAIHNVMIGEAGKGDTDVLWLHGKHGFYLTSNQHAQDTILYYRDNDNYLYSNRTILAPRYVTPLTISPSTQQPSSQNKYTINAIDILANLSTNPIQQQQSLNSISEASNCISYHLNAAELQQVVPYMILTDNNGVKYIDYSEMVPILIAAINELSAEVNRLKTEDSPVVMRASSSIDDSDITIASLSQNRPNPFANTSTIAYTLPDGTRSASLFIYDLKGTQVTSYPCHTSNQSGAITISASDFKEGMYFYTLIADGKEVGGTKRMIVTR